MTFKNFSTIFGSLLITSWLAAGVLGEEPQKKNGVTFENRTRDTQHVLVTYGGPRCGEMTEKTQLTIEPNAVQTADTSGAKACWCSSSLGKVGDCAEWTKAKPGKKVVLRPE